MDRPKTIVSDFHGVFTDGKLHYGPEGKLFIETISHRDRRAIQDLKNAGYRIIIYTKSDSKTIEKIAKYYKLELIVSQDKKPPIDEPYIGIGEDIPDYDFVYAAAFRVCPNDAHSKIKNICNTGNKSMICQSNGGNGVFSELYDYLKQRQFLI